MSERCPYCGGDIEINHDDGYGYSEYEIHQQECGNCGKSFAFTTSSVIYYHLKKADCLNDGEHSYQETITYPRRYTKLKCLQCGDEKPLPDERPYLINGEDRATSGAIGQP